MEWKTIGFDLHFKVIATTVFCVAQWSRDNMNKVHLPYYFAVDLSDLNLGNSNFKTFDEISMQGHEMGEWPSCNYEKNAIFLDVVLGMVLSDPDNTGPQVG